MDKPIVSFKGRYRFLSNFYESEIWMDGYRYPTVEHAYQAAKVSHECLYFHSQRKKIREVKSPTQAKRLGHMINLRDDWEDVKVHIMKELVLQKFARCFDLRKRLFETGDAILVEGNDWGDTFWGQCKGEGCNELGKILMSVRCMLSNG